MRRLLVLVPAALMLLTVALPARANDPGTSLTVSPCYTDPNTGEVWDTGTFTVTVKWDETTDPSQHLLHRFTVNSACNDAWMKVRFRRSTVAGSGPFLTFFVQPGAVRSIGIQGLQKLGVYQWSFNRYAAYNGPGSRHAGPPPCVQYQHYSGGDKLGGYILASGTVDQPPPCPA
jgi:hypothetical protein